MPRLLRLILLMILLASRPASSCEPCETTCAAKMTGAKSITTCDRKGYVRVLIDVSYSVLYALGKCSLDGKSCRLRGYRFREEAKEEDLRRVWLGLVTGFLSRLDRDSRMQVDVILLPEPGKKPRAFKVRKLKETLALLRDQPKSVPLGTESPLLSGLSDAGRLLGEDTECPDAIVYITDGQIKEPAAVDEVLQAKEKRCAGLIREVVRNAKSPPKVRVGLGGSVQLYFARLPTNDAWRAVLDDFYEQTQVGDRGHLVDLAGCEATQICPPENALTQLVDERVKLLAADPRNYCKTSVIEEQVTNPACGGSDEGNFADVAVVGNEHGWHCSGISISPHLLLTARHCLPASRVFFGDSVDDAGVEIRVVDAILAPHASVDLAILRLDQKVDVLRARRRGHSESLTGVLRTVGFGAVDSSGLFGFGRRHFTDQPISSWGCDHDRATQLGCDADTELVMPSSGGRDTCDGDSGGPVFERNQVARPSTPWR